MWNKICTVTFSVFADFLCILTFILAATRAKCGATGFQCRNKMWTRSEINVDEKWNFPVPTFMKQLPLKACPAFLPRSFHKSMWTKSERNVDEQLKQCGQKVATKWPGSRRNVERKWPHCAAHFFFWKLRRFHRVCRLTMVTNRCKP